MDELTLTDEELLSLNLRGFIPGPNETECAFLSRVSATQEGFGRKESIPRAHWEWVREHLKELFGFSPESLVAFYSNASLAPWQGAACWIDEQKIPELQLREGFRKGHYLRLYSREETLAHESIHAARAAFDEPENEEFFAYASSEKKWRRVYGPIVKKPRELWILWFFVLSGNFHVLGWIAAQAWITVGVYRLTVQHLRRNKAIGTLQKAGHCEKSARAILLRLTDKEIRGLAKGEKLLGDDSLRWRLLRLAYFL